MRRFVCALVPIVFIPLAAAAQSSGSRWQLSADLRGTDYHYNELREWRDMPDRTPPSTTFDMRGVGLSLQALLELDPDSTPRFLHRLEGGVYAGKSSASAPHPIDGHDFGGHIALFPFARPLGVQPFLSLGFGALLTRYNYEVSYQTGSTFTYVQSTSHVTLAPGVGADVRLIGPASLRLELSEVAAVSGGAYSNGPQLSVGLMFAHSGAKPSSGTSSPAPGASVRIADPRVEGVRAPSDTAFESFTFNDSLSIDAAAAASRLATVYEGLGLAVAERDPSDLAVTSRIMRVRGQFAGLPLSRYFDCGQSALGPLANLDEVQFRVSTVLQPLQDRRTLVRTALSATASGDGNRGSTTRCNSTGLLEREIARRIATDTGEQR